MFSVDLSTRECGGYVVVALRGELDLADAADVAAALAAAVAREPGIIVDLAGLGFIDCGGVAALARGRRHARQAGGDLLLAAPQQRVLRVLAITRLAGEFSVHASVEEAAGSAGRSGREAVPVPRRSSTIRWPRPAVRSGTQALGSGARYPRRQAGGAGARSPSAAARSGPAHPGWPGFPVGCPRGGRAGSSRPIRCAGCADDR